VSNTLPWTTPRPSAAHLIILLSVAHTSVAANAWGLQQTVIRGAILLHVPQLGHSSALPAL